MHWLKRILLVVAGVVVVVVAGVTAIGFFLSPQDQLRRSDLIIAISGGETGQRTHEAVTIYNEGYAPKLLFSGAAADRTGPSNAAAMRADAIRQGVPPDAIVIEGNSVTTAENAADAAPIIHQLGAHSIILVTSPYHQRRASLSFHQALGPGVTIINHSASDSDWRKSTWWQHSNTIALTLDELQKTLYVWLTQPSS